MKISYNVEIPEVQTNFKIRPTSEEVKALLLFLDSPKKSMCFEYTNKKEAERKAPTLTYYKKRHHHTHYEIFRRQNRIYAVKKEEDIQC